MGLAHEHSLKLATDKNADNFLLTWNTTWENQTENFKQTISKAL